MRILNACVGRTLLSLIFLCSCVSKEAVVGTHNTRELLQRDVEDQIVYNLIRGKHGLPFSHYDIVSLQYVAENKVTPSGSFGKTITHNTYGKAVQTSVDPQTSHTPSSVQTTVGSVSSAIETVAHPYSVMSGYENDATVTITASPIHDEPDLYKAYVTFLNMKEGDDLDKTQKSEETSAKAAKPTQGATTTTTNEVVVPGTGNDKNPKFTTTSRTVQTVENPPEDSKPAGIDGFEAKITSIVMIPTKKRPKEGTYKKWTLQVVQDENDPQHPWFYYEPKEGHYVKHTLKYWEGNYYFVPIAYQKDFSDLCLAVVSRKPSSASSSSSSSSSGSGSPTHKEMLMQNSILNSIQNSLSH